MFLSRSDPPAINEANLRGMCVSLNNPVVNIEDLPVCPARALIALHDVEGMGTELSVAIRSLESGRLAFFTFEGELKKASSPTAVMDGALSFAEGMGFLFDEDLIEFGGNGGRQRALRHWREFLGEPAPALGSRAASVSVEVPEVVPEPAPTPSGAQLPGLELDEEILEASGELPQELVLDDLLELVEDDSGGPPAAPAPVAEADFGAAVESGSAVAVADTLLPGAGSPAAPDLQTALPLTKFRRAGDVASGEQAVAVTCAKAGSMKTTSGPSPLGRVPIVKMRMGDDGQAKADFVMRLLRSF